MRKKKVVIKWISTTPLESVTVAAEPESKLKLLPEFLQLSSNLYDFYTKSSSLEIFSSICDDFSKEIFAAESSSEDDSSRTTEQAKKILLAISQGELKESLEKNRIERAILTLFHQTIVSMARVVKSNMDILFTKKRELKGQITQHIQMLDGNYSSGQRQILSDFLDRLILTDLQSYYQPSKDPMMTQLFRSITFLYNIVKQ